MLDKKRATQAEDKALRRASILKAAADLFLENPQQLPSVIRIAQASGLAKGTVYLYFKTKEEIFQALLEEQIMNQLSLMQQGINDRLPLNTLIKNQIEYIRHHPSLLPLASMAKSVLEQNLEMKCGEEFKRKLAVSMKETALMLEAQIPALTGKGEKLLLRTFAIILGLWQMLDWPEHLEHLKSEEMFKLFNLDFYDEINETLVQMWMPFAGTQPE